MSNTTLKTTRRDGTGKGVARKMRERGQTPAVLYGGKESTLHLALDTHDADYLFRSISVDNTIVELEVEGEKEPVQALVREKLRQAAEQTKDFVQIRYQELDRITAHGIRALPEDSTLFKAVPN